MLDVHPPHEAAHSWRDFFTHLLTITIGLLIALSLEGCVEWAHHRHLVHEAQEGLHDEVQSNAETIADGLKTLHLQQDALKKDVDVMNVLIKDGKVPSGTKLDIAYSMHTLRDVSWKTAQNTGALALMSYKEAQEYAEIYTTQEKLNLADQQATRDTILSLAPFSNSSKDDADPTHGEAQQTREKLQVLQGQLLLVDALMNSLEKQYKNFLDTHHG